MNLLRRSYLCVLGLLSSISFADAEVFYYPINHEFDSAKLCQSYLQEASANFETQNKLTEVKAFCSEYRNSEKFTIVFQTKVALESPYRTTDFRSAAVAVIPTLKTEVIQVLKFDEVNQVVFKTPKVHTFTVDDFLVRVVTDQKLCVDQLKKYVEKSYKNTVLFSYCEINDDKKAEGWKYVIHARIANL